MTPTPASNPLDLLPGLLHCPCCAGKAAMDGKSETLWIRCLECSLRGRPFDFDADDDADIERAQNEARVAWNRRTPAPSLKVSPQAVDRVVECSECDGMGYHSDIAHEPGETCIRCSGTGRAPQLSGNPGQLAQAPGGGEVRVPVILAGSIQGWMDKAIRILQEDGGQTRTYQRGEELLRRFEAIQAAPPPPPESNRGGDAREFPKGPLRDDVLMVDALFGLLPSDEVEVEKAAWERLREALPPEVSK